MLKRGRPPSLATILMFAAVLFAAVQCGLFAAFYRPAAPVPANSLDDASVHAGSDLYRVGLPALGILVSLGAAALLRRRLTASFDTFTSCLSRSATVSSRIDPGRLAYREFVELASAVNRTVDARLAADQALRERHEWCKAVQESVPWGIVIIDCSDGRIVDLNTAAGDLIGLAREQIVNRTCAGFICPDEGERCPALCAGHRAEESESVLVRHDGRRLPILKSVRRVRLGGKEFLVEGFMDLTEKRRLERQLQQAQRMEAIGVLAGGIAHDFNNILAGIIGYTQLAMFGQPDNCSGELNEVLKAANRAKDLVKQILAFSRRGDEERMPVKVAQVVREVVKFLRATIPSNIEIITKVDEKSGAVLGNSVELHQILMNLCTNAVHAIGNGGGALEILVRNEKIENARTRDFLDLEIGPYIRISVKDTGPGIAPEALGRIFDPYFTTKAKGLGTGLGLAVVHGIVRKMGGTIRVQSEPGRGAAFHIYLPRIETPPLLQVEHRRTPKGRSERILVVDDEPSLAELTQRILVRLGYDVVARTDPAEALELFEADPERFDLVITDQTMPGMTGELLAEKLMQVRPGVPVILCTGYSPATDPERARGKGVKGFVLKPIPIQELAHEVRRVLEEAGVGARSGTVHAKRAEAG